MTARMKLPDIEGELQLFCGLGRGPEPMRTVSRKLMPQLLDQYRLRLELGQKPCREGTEFLGIVGRGEVLAHYRERGKAEGHMGELKDVLAPALSSINRAKCKRCAGPVVSA